MKYILYTFSFLFLFPVLVLAQKSASSSGTFPALFLRSGISVKATGLSEAYTALADDESALFYNSAGLVKTHGMTFALNHTEWLEDIRFDNFTYSWAINSSFATGIYFSHMWMPAIKGFDASGNATSDVTVSSSIIGLAGAYKIAKGIYSGLGLKYINDNLDKSTANGIVFDAGFLWDTPLSGLSFGIAGQNIGGKLKYGKHKYDIPQTIRSGIAYRLRPIPLLFSIDVVKPQDTDIIINFGSEYTILKKFYIQLGYQYRTDSPFTPSFGLGGNITDQIALMYSFSSPNEIGFTNRFGFKFELGKKKRTFAYSKPLIGNPNPQVPKGLSAEIKNNSLYISWEYANPSAKYIVYAKNESGNWVKLTKIPIADNFLILKKPTSDKSFTFSVTSIIGDEESEYSKEVILNVN